MDCRDCKRELTRLPYILLLWAVLEGNCVRHTFGATAPETRVQCKVSVSGSSQGLNCR